MYLDKKLIKHFDQKLIEEIEFLKKKMGKKIAKSNVQTPKRLPFTDKCLVITLSGFHMNNGEILCNTNIFYSLLCCFVILFRV